MTNTNKYAAKKNRYGQTIIVPAATAHLPHVLVSWHDAGMGSCGHTAVLPGETPEEAGRRAFWSKVPSCYESSFTVRLDELTDC